MFHEYEEDKSSLIEYINCYIKPMWMYAPHEGCSLSVIDVYGYMLYKYTKLKLLDQNFYETVKTISNFCEVSEEEVKESLQWLRKNGFLKFFESSKKYLVLDKYNIYNKDGDFSENSLETIKEQPDVLFKIIKDIEYTHKINKPEFVYLISDGIHQKIGVSSNIKRRLNDLQTSNSRNLYLVSYYKPNYKNAFLLEAGIHNIFKESRLIGEWFNMQLSGDEFNKVCQSLDVACN